MLYREKILVFLLLFSIKCNSQIPTVQDCLGAIPVCQNQYNQSSIYYGNGHYQNEINPNISCLDIEYYSVWYTFTAQTSGFFRFSITPNTPSNDYDWAVFNLTNAMCADIESNPLLCISCNSFGDLMGVNGNTGANSANGGTDNWNGPGGQNGPPWNADIPVTAGSTYAMLICNWSQSTSGYSLDFNGSTAEIFDNVPPTLMAVQQSLCGDSTISFQFSEYIMCNSVQSSDFKIIDQNGAIIPVISVVGPACAAGGNQERFFKALTPFHLQEGNYKLLLCGPVNDLCGNINDMDTLPFVITGLDFETSSTEAICNPNGTATCVALNGQVPYTYHWADGGATSVITGLNPGTYHVTATDSHGCLDSTFVVVQAGSGSIAALLIKQDVNCYGANSGSITARPLTGISPFTFQWSNGISDSIIQNLQPGTYRVTIADVYGCLISDSITLYENPPFYLMLDSIQDEICSYSNGAIYTHAEGGIAPYRFVWSQNETLDLTYACGLRAGGYTLSVYDSLNCMQSLNITVGGQPYPIADFQALPNRAFLDQAVIKFANNSQNYTNAYWDFGDMTNSIETAPTHQYNSLGCFPVMLVVQSENMCVDTLVKYVDIVEDFRFYIPNAFTPDDDALNDSFGPVFKGVSSSDYLFEIYDRWGGILFTTNDIYKRWDGKTPSGESYPGSVYVYRILVSDLCNNMHFYSGNIFLCK